MDKNNDGRFVFGADELGAPSTLGDGSRARLDSLSLKVTLIAVIMPCLIGIVMAFGYIDMNRRVAAFKDTGSAEVRSASKDMERMVSSLQVQNARIEKRLNEELGEIKARLSTLESEVKKTRKDVDFITATRLTKKQTEARLGTLENRITKNDKALSLLQSDAAETIDRTRALEKQTSSGAQSLTRLQGDVAAARKELNALSRSIPSLEEIDTRLKKERIFTQKRIDVVRDSLTKRIDTLEKKRQAPASPAPTAPPAPRPGTIVEQEIGD